MILTLAALLAGAAFGGALLVAVTAFRTPLPHLAHTLTALRTDTTTADHVPGSGDPGAAAGLVDRWGRWVLRAGRINPSARQTAQLRLRGISLSRFYGERLTSALLCAAMVAMLAASASSFGVTMSLTVPSGGVLLAAVFGWFLPALRISANAKTVAEDASEALLVYIDLVILERMANQHAKDALTRAAKVSDNPLFLQIQAALARAELEREPPWTEIRRLGEQLNMPQLADIADIARMQEEGGSLAAAFRARVAELRNAHVVQRQQEADRITQRMEIPKVLPVVVVSFILIMPPLLRVAG